MYNKLYVYDELHIKSRLCSNNNLNNIVIKKIQSGLENGGGQPQT